MMAKYNDRSIQLKEQLSWIEIEKRYINLLKEQLPTNTNKDFALQYPLKTFLYSKNHIERYQAFLNKKSIELQGELKHIDEDTPFDKVKWLSEQYYIYKNRLSLIRHAYKVASEAHTKLRNLTSNTRDFYKLHESEFYINSNDFAMPKIEDKQYAEQFMRSLRMQETEVNIRLKILAEMGANINYTPSIEDHTHNAHDITQDQLHRFVTDEQILNWSNNTSKDLSINGMDEGSISIVAGSNVSISNNSTMKRISISSSHPSINSSNSVSNSSNNFIQSITLDSNGHATNIESGSVDLTHDHDGTYSPVHDHPYANLAHEHTKEDITDFAHEHTKDDITDFEHDHNGVYSDINHNHSGVYSPIHDHPYAGLYHEHFKEDITDFAHEHTKEDITDFAHDHDEIYSPVHDHPYASSLHEHQASDVIQDETHRFVTDTEKALWNNKQDALNYTPENIINKGVANGYAELDSTGRVPSSQLPSFVDDVLEYNSLELFPQDGESGKIYIDINTNKTYRWSGTTYIEISQSLALGTTSSTAYRGDRGDTAYQHSQITSGNPHNVTKSDIGLDNVDNTSDEDKPISIAVQNALDSKSGIDHDHDNKYSLIHEHPYAASNHYHNASNINSGVLSESRIPNLNMSKITTGNLDATRVVEPNYVRGSITDMAKPLFDVLRADRTAFLPAEQIIIEQSTDAGLTWQDAQITDDDKRKLFTGHRPLIRIPLKDGVKNTDCMIRVTITAMRYNVPVGTPETEKYNYWNSTNVLSAERYCLFDETWIWLSSNSDYIHCKVERAKGNDPNTWVIDGEGFMAGWSGGNYMRLGSNTFGGSTSQPGNYWNWRFTFRTATKDNDFDNAKLSTTNTTTAQNVNHIKIVGRYFWTASNNLMRHDHIYSWDVDQNTTFPAEVKATTFRNTSNTEVSYSGHKHVKADVTDFTHTHAKSDVTDFSHNHTKSEIADFTHTHIKSDITDFSHTHTKSEVTDFTHTHTKTDITDFTHSHDDLHTHNNKALLDTYTQTEANLSDAVAKRHSRSHGITSTNDHTASGLTTGHVLQALSSTTFGFAAIPNHTHTKSDISDFTHTHTQSEITDFAHSHDELHTHSNKALLDTYTQTEVNLADAVTKRHARSHSLTSTSDHTVSGLTTGHVLQALSATTFGFAALPSHDHAYLATMNGIAPNASNNFTLNAGTGITITPGTNALTITATGGVTPAAHASEHLATGTDPIVLTASQLVATDANGKLTTVINDLHTHSNKALLDTYAQTETNLADAVTKRHTRSHSITSTSDHTASDLTTGHVLQALSATTFGFAAIPTHTHTKANISDFSHTHLASEITQDASNRFVSDAEKGIWNGKQDTITGAASTITSSNLTASRALVSDSSGKVAVSTITSTKLGYLSNVTSDIQSQLNSKQSSLGYTPEDTSNKGVANGYAPLDENGKVPVENLSITGAKKASFFIGDGLQNTFVLTHNLNDSDVIVQVRDTLNGEIVFPDILIEDNNTVLIQFSGIIPSNNEFRVVIIG